MPPPCQLWPSGMEIRKATPLRIVDLKSFFKKRFLLLFVAASVDSVRVKVSVTDSDGFFVMFVRAFIGF